MVIFTLTKPSVVDRWFLNAMQTCLATSGFQTSAEKEIPHNAACGTGRVGR
jgi:hypothetical protein